MSRSSIERQAVRTLLGNASWQQKIFALCLLVVLAGSAYWATAKPGVDLQNTDGLYGTVVGVADGDTVTVLDAQQQTHKIRLAFIDAPEKSQPYGLRAKQSLSDKVFRQNVQVEVIEKDRYGREVGRIRLDGRDINLSLVAEGYAWHYRYYAEKNQDSADFQRYETAQSQAQQEKRGLWQDANPQPPWDFRRQSRQ